MFYEGPTEMAKPHFVTCYYSSEETHDQSAYNTFWANTHPQSSTRGGRM